VNWPGVALPHLDDILRKFEFDKTVLTAWPQSLNRAENLRFAISTAIPSEMLSPMKTASMPPYRST
jgi:hypothetical protein